MLSITLWNCIKLYLRSFKHKKHTSGMNIYNTGHDVRLNYHSQQCSFFKWRHYNK